jgi:hypothetical protein
MIDHRDIIPIVPTEMSGLSMDTDLGTKDKESGHKIIKEFVNKNTSNVKTVGQILKEDGCTTLGIIADADKIKEQIYKFPIYRGHIKNKLYSDGIPILNHRDKVLNPGIYCWSMSDLLQCKSVTDIASSPLIIDLVSNYLGCLPTCYGINCMLSNGISQHGTTRRHRDSDDFKFLSLFIYLSDVTLQNGPHVYEMGTHLGNPDGAKGNEIPINQVRKEIILGSAGTGFIEDNWGVHYGMPLQPNNQRICLWIRYGLYDNYTARNSVYMSEHSTMEHEVDMTIDINKYVFRFLLEDK